METFELRFFNIKRNLPIVSVTPKIKIASFNLLGDVELVKKSAEVLIGRLKEFEFDCLVGPEVKVVPLIHEIATLLGQKRYVIFRKSVMGYMIKPVLSKTTPGLVLDGKDISFLKGKKVAIIDDVVSTGKTILALNDFLEELGAKVVVTAAVLKQEGASTNSIHNLIYLKELPVFKNTR